MKSKIVAVISVLALGLGFSSCDQSEVEENLEAFATTKVDYDITYVIKPDLFGITESNIEALNPGGDCASQTVTNDRDNDNSQNNIPVNFQETLEAETNDSSIVIKKVSLDKIELSLSQSQDANNNQVSDFNFINNVALYLIEPSGDFLKLGEKENVQDLDAVSFTLDNLTDRDFQDFTDQSEIRVAAEVTVNRVCKKEISIGTALTFLIEPCISITNEAQQKCNQ